MSYYGLPPTKFANEYNEFEKLLRALPLDGAIKALDLLETITRNTAQSPQEEKFRRVRTTNEKLSALFGLPGIIPVMECMGWQQDGEFLQLPKSVKLDFPQHVVKILEAKSHFGKLQESEKRAAKLGQDGLRESLSWFRVKSRIIEDPNKAELLKQLELDRRERGSAPRPEAPAAVQPMSEEEQLQDRFLDPEKKRQEQEMSLADIRAMQKQKFKELHIPCDFQADPNAKTSEAYKRPAAIAPGGSEEKGWFDWMWGGSSSSSGGYGGGGGGKPDKPDRQGPKMKTIKDARGGFEAARCLDMADVEQRPLDDRMQQTQFVVYGRRPDQLAYLRTSSHPAANRVFHEVCKVQADASYGRS
eukprot:s39_g19.t1